jgi:hypothetical protein
MTATQTLLRDLVRVPGHRTETYLGAVLPPALQHMRFATNGGAAKEYVTRSGAGSRCECGWSHGGNTRGEAQSWARSHRMEMRARAVVLGEMQRPGSCEYRPTSIDSLYPYPQDGKILARIMPRRWLHDGPMYGMEFDEPHLMVDPTRGWESWSWWPSWTDLYALAGWESEPPFTDEHSRAFWLIRSEKETS